MLWWWARFSILCWGEIFHTGSEQKRKRREMKIKSDTIMPCLGFSQQIAAIWRQWEWALSEFSLKRFHSCYVFCLLSMKNNQSRGSVEDNVSDLWHKRMSVTGGLFWTCRYLSADIKNAINFHRYALAGDMLIASSSNMLAKRSIVWKYLALLSLFCPCLEAFHEIQLCAVI